MPVYTRRFNTEFKEEFIEDLNKIFPWYKKEELTELLGRSGWLFLPVDLRLYLDNIYYPNDIERIMVFFASPGKPVNSFEFYNFWMHLTPLERIEFKFAELS
jgi:hypothetical protein